MLVLLHQSDQDVQRDFKSIADNEGRGCFSQIKTKVYVKKANFRPQEPQNFKVVCPSTECVGAPLD